MIYHICNTADNMFQTVGLATANAPPLIQVIFQNYNGIAKLSPFYFGIQSYTFTANV